MMIGHDKLVTIGLQGSKNFSLNACERVNSWFKGGFQPILS